jgi:hypothetical protein
MTEAVQSEWVFVGHCFDGETFEIEGLDVWKHSWVSTDQHASVSDPLWNQAFLFPVYAMSGGGKTIKFAAGEFSNNVWGFFQRKYE